MTKGLITYCFLFFSLVPYQTWAQFENPEIDCLFNDATIPRIDIFLDTDDLDFILHPSNAESDTEFPATMYFTKNGQTDTLDNIGFRLRGNTSRYSAKKSFKVSINAFEKGRKFYGVEKLNLNGEHNDPTIMRSKICWDMYRMADIPCSRSNHVALYINTQYRGLYINVEHIDEEFIQKRFYQGHGNLYKCLWPADLHYKGDNPSLYKTEQGGRRTYDLKTNNEEDDYSDLANFIDVLNNTPLENLPCELERVFDVDSYLKAVAMDVLVGNWDGPIVNKNNFYLYSNPADGRFSYIPYDLDNTFGIDWFGVDWATTGIYNWSSYSNDYRPIYERMIQVNDYRNKLSYYYEKFVNEFFNEIVQQEYLLDKSDQLFPFRNNDFFSSLDYGWDADDFLTNFNEALGAHVKYGLSDYLATRALFVGNHVVTPLEEAFVSKANVLRSSDNILFDIQVENIEVLESLEIEYSVNGENFVSEGISTDGNSGQYNYSVNDIGELRYRLVCTSSSGDTYYWPSCNYYEISLGEAPTPDIKINEIMSFNNSTVTDEFDEYDDWIELYNADVNPVTLDEFYLSDDPQDRTKWKLPFFNLYPEEYVIIWADGQESQGDYHANFRLNRKGEYLALYENVTNDFAIVDEVNTPSMEEDKSYGRLPNGTGEFTFLPYVTFGENNETSSVSELSDLISIFPNPTTDIISIKGVETSEIINTTIIDQTGRLVTSTENHSINLTGCKSGIYTLLLQTKEGITSLKLIKL